MLIHFYIWCEVEDQLYFFSPTTIQLFQHHLLKKIIFFLHRMILTPLWALRGMHDQFISVCGSGFMAVPYCLYLWSYVPSLKSENVNCPVLFFPV